MYLTEKEIFGQYEALEKVQLVTMPCPCVGSVITLRYGSSRKIGLIGPSHFTKALNAGRKLLELLKVGLEGEISITHVPPNLKSGLGVGRSSADVIGVLRIILTALEFPENRAEELLAQLAQRAERAVDPLMFQQPVLFASREGIVLKKYSLLPRMAAIGFVFDHVVDTVALADRQAREGSPTQNLAFAPMVVKLFEAGIERNDAKQIIKAAMLSAQLNQALVAFPHFSRLHDFAEKAGVGLSISHSGSAGALLLAGVPRPAEVATIAHHFETEFQTQTFHWRLPC